MKNSNQSGIGSSVRKSVSIFLMLATLALTNGAKAADLKSKPAADDTNMSLTHSSDQNSTLDASQPQSGDPSLDGNPTLIAEHLAFFCVTNYGTFALNYPLPSGASCYVQSLYWPYTYVYGIAE